MNISVELSSRLSRLVKNKFDMSKPMQRAQMKATLMIQNTGKEYSPYKTGALRKSITHDFAQLSS